MIHNVSDQAVVDKPALSVARSTDAASTNHAVPPEMLGLSAHRIGLPTGVELEYVEKGDPAGQAVVLLHGLSDSWRTWQRNLPLLSPIYHTYALSQRGHGDSSKPRTGYSLADLAGDVIAFMDRLDIEAATLVGHSMGSFVAHQVAVNHPLRVQRLVLIGSAPTMVNNPALPEFNAYVQTMQDPIDAEFVREFQASTAFNPIPAAFLDTVVAESLKLPATVWQQLFADFLVEDHSARLGSITAKTLIMCGDRDEYFPLAGQHELHTAIRDSRLLIYAASGHSPHWEWPQRFVDDLSIFLRD